MRPVCPAADELLALLHDTGTASAELTSHLEACPHCQERLEVLAAGRDEWLHARHLGDAAPPAEEALGRVLADLRRGPGAATDDAPPSDLPPGFLDAPRRPGDLGRLGDYNITGVISRGPMSIVLKAFDDALHRALAIKVLAPHLATSAAARTRFLREGRAAAAVCHEHVVPIHAVDESKGLPYLVMPFVPGLSLQEKLDREGPLPVVEVVRIAAQAARGLAAAHEQGVIHRDVKPANILLENGVERVKLADFGLARAADDASVTQSGVVAGTPQYMAPEQADGAPVDHRADLFSLGSVIYAMCAGRPPFRASSTLAVLRRVVEDEPRPLSEVNPDVPAWLEDIVHQLHAKDPRDRPSSAAEVAEILSQELAHLQTGAGGPPRRPRIMARRRRRRPTVVALALGWCVFLFCCIGTPVLGIVALVTHLVSDSADAPQPMALRDEVFPPPDPPPPPWPLRATLRDQAMADLLALAYAEDGLELASGESDGTVRLWNLRSKALRASYRVSTRGITALQYGPGRGRLFVGTSGGEVIALDAAGRVEALGRHDDAVQSLAFFGGGRLASASADRTVKVWNTLKREEPVVLGSTAAVNAVAVSPGGQLLAGAGPGFGIKVWETERWSVSGSLPAKDTMPACLAFSPTGRGLAAGGWGRVSLIRLGRGVPTVVDDYLDLPPIAGRDTPLDVLRLAYAPDGRHLAASCGLWHAEAEPVSRVVVWDIDRRRVRHQTDLVPGFATGVAFAPDGRSLATACGDRAIRLWSVSDWVTAPEGDQ